MLQKTFIHIEGVGEKTERRLWQHGADSWDAYLAAPERFPLPAVRRAQAVDVLAHSSSALVEGDFRFFARRLQGRHHWRALPSFAGRVAYLDIETNGATGPDCVTVIGLYREGQVHQFVRGENLLDFPDALDEVAVLVTFFGAGFDLPVLRETFPLLRFDQLHVDLCPALRRLGFSGGLKKIEAAVGLQRSRATAGLSGWDAVRLWHEYLHGREASLHTLLQYNAEDIVHLAPLADLVYRELRRHVEGDINE